MSNGMNTEPPFLIYDGDCPFCSRYADFVQLRDSIGLRLVDARSSRALVTEAEERGLDLDAGMVLVLSDRTLQGEEAVAELEQLLTSPTLSHRLFRRLASSRVLRGGAYPILLLLRRVLLFMRGRALIHPARGEPKSVQDRSTRPLDDS